MSDTFRLYAKEVDLIIDSNNSRCQEILFDRYICASGEAGKEAFAAALIAKVIVLNAQLKAKRGG